MRFEVGDKVKRIDGCHMGMRRGDEGIISEIAGNIISIRRFGEGHLSEMFELVQKVKQTSGKPTKQKPIVKHVVIQESCTNTIGFYDSYKEATSKIPDKNEIYNVYELVHVAKVENAPKVTRIKPVKKKKKVSKKGK